MNAFEIMQEWQNVAKVTDKAMLEILCDYIENQDDNIAFESFLGRVEITEDMLGEWSGSPDPSDPANYWIDDATGERVNAATGERTKTLKLGDTTKTVDIQQTMTVTVEDSSLPLGVTINNNHIVLLDGMAAKLSGKGPGAYDFISYRGWEILTHDDGEIDSNGMYVGPFSICEGGPLHGPYANLQTAKHHIDRRVDVPKPSFVKNVPHEMTTTIAQSKMLYAKWIQLQNNEKWSFITFHDFMDTVQPVFGGDGAVTVPWCGMWLCIEKDGYCHS